ncbi:MAG: hypothetical protein ACLFSQ_12890 [Candidatus Zixiibacteriota bacterium]
MKKFFIIFAMLAAFIASGETVYDIQYSTTGESPLLGETVTVSAVVTATGFSGDKFFISDPEGGPWRGVYVFDYSIRPSVGDWITLTAEVEEYYELTELKDVSDYSIDGTRAVPDAHIATCSEVDSEESLEGVLVKVYDVEIESIGEYNWIISDETGTLNVSDGFDYSFTPEVGVSLDSIIGVVDYSFGNYVLQPRSDADITGEAEDTTVTVTPIADIQDDFDTYDGQSVTIQGVITVPGGSTRDDQLNAWIQDESGKGIQLFAYDIPDDSLAFRRGTEIRVDGVVGEYNSTTQVSDFSYEIISTGNPLPAAANIDSVWDDRVDYEGTWTMMSGYVSDLYSAGGGMNVTVDTDAGHTSLIRIWETTGIELTADIGDRITAYGVGSIYSDDYQMLPGLPEDIITEGSTDTISEPALKVPETVYWHDDNTGDTYNIEFGAPIGYTITLRLFDRLGRECGTLFHGQPASRKNIAWDGRDETGRLVKPGTYLLHMTVESATGSLDSKTETIVIGSKL